MTRFALPVQERTKRAVFGVIATHGTSYNMLEVWLACIRDLDTAFVRKLIAVHGRRLILIVRPPKNETHTIAAHKKREILTLAGCSAVLVDLDIKTERSELDRFATHRWACVASFHNHRETPPSEKLLAIVKDMKRWHPAICKIATFCRTPDDALRLLQILRMLKKCNTACIVLGMGPMGVSTRIFGSLWGNEMIFAPMSKTKQSAPGQLTLHELQSIFRQLKEA